MNNANNRLKQMYFIVLAIYVLTLCYSFASGFINQDMNRVGMSVVSVLCLLIIPSVFYICKWIPVYEIYILGTIFMYFASLIGSCLGGYSVPYFDKVVHFFSGVFATLLAIMIFSLVKRCKLAKTKADYQLLLIFINAMNLAIAAIWEFYEYAVLIFLDNDAINHYSQGVHDSMSDMLSAFVGGLLITVIVMRRYRLKKANFFTNLPERFYEKNIANK